MRKTFVLFSFFAFVAACNNSGSSSGAQDTSTSKTEQTTPAQDTTAEKGLNLIAKAGVCFGCHAIAEKKIGPAYNDVAARYENNPAVIDSLSDKIMKGGSGNWGTIAMPANPVNKEDAKAMVEYILSLKK